MATYATTSVVPSGSSLSALTLGTTDCGFVHKVTGGSIYAEVVRERAVAGHMAMKHLAGVKYEPFELQVGFTMAKPLFGWIASSWKGEGHAQSGSIFDCNEKREIKAERRFVNALITETVVPTLDLASKDPAWLTVKFAAEHVDYKKSSGTAKGALPKNPEKMLPASGFRLEIGGLDCSKVRKIESFQFQQQIAENAVGQLRDYERIPGSIDFTDLHVTFAEVTADSWSQWFDDFVVKGDCGQDREKKGKLTLLSANQQTLATIHLYQVGIHRFGALDAAPGDDKLKLATASLYCERMELEHT